MIRSIVNMLNCTLPFDGKYYGIASYLKRGGVILPHEGETYIGLDDIYKIQIYHKLNGMTATLKPASGYGDQKAYQVNAYNMSMIVFNNRSGVMVDELLLLMQSNFPQIMKMEPYSQIAVTFNNAILNDRAVYGQEYGSIDTYKLGVSQNLFQINYTVETTFSPGCFAKCPEELLSNFKN